MQSDWLSAEPCIHKIIVFFALNPIFFSAHEKALLKRNNLLDFKAYLK